MSDNFRIGTPLDYTEGLYRFYFEVQDTDGSAEEIFKKFLGPNRVGCLVRLGHGYELELPIQCAPDVVRRLAKKNIAVYQVVRYAKVSGT
ncbi:MAG: hypothetical protein ACR2PH_17215 [Desulfobulbia bacterium]